MNIAREINNLTLLLCQKMSISGLGISEQTGHDNQLIIIKEQLAQLNQSLKFISSASKGDKEAIETALQNGVSTTGCDLDGASPLFSAAYHGHSDCLKILLAHGADPLVNRDDGMTPLMAAAWSGSDEAVKLLINRSDPLADTCSKQMTALMYAACKGSPGCVRLLIPYGGVDARDHRGYTPLMLAVEQSASILTVQELIGHSELDAKSTDGKSILQISQLNGRTEMTDFIAGYRHALFEMSQLSATTRSASVASKKSLSL